MNQQPQIVRDDIPHRVEHSTVIELAGAITGERLFGLVYQAAGSDRFLLRPLDGPTAAWEPGMHIQDAPVEKILVAGEVGPIEIRAHYCYTRLRIEYVVEERADGSIPPVTDVRRSFLVWDAFIYRLEAYIGRAMASQEFPGLPFGNAESVA